MNKQNRKHYFALTFLITTLIFFIQFFITSITAAIIYLLVHFQVITLDTDIRPNIGMIILYMIVISNIVGVIVAYFSSKISARPLQNVIYQIDRLASGDFSARLDFGWPISKHPVFSQLSHSFNRMASELKNTEMLRGDFVNNFSHEFKTPIVSIAGFAKLLRRGNLTEEQKEEYLAVIEEESLRLSDMATNVLNMTRVENQTILTDVVKFNLSEQIRSSILLLADKWEKKQLDFNVDFGEYRISANEELLKQVMRSSFLQTAVLLKSISRINRIPCPCILSIRERKFRRKVCQGSFKNFIRLTVHTPVREMGSGLRSSKK